MHEVAPVYERIGTGERAFLTFIVIVGVFMAILDTTIVEVIVPKIMAPLSTDLYGVQWVITAYMISAATGLLVVESLTRSLGLKNVFILGLVIFYICELYVRTRQKLGGNDPFQVGTRKR